MPAQVYSGQMADDIELATFVGGLVDVPDVIADGSLEANQTPRCQNVDLTGRSIRKMKGFTRVTTNTVTGDISTLFYDEFTQNVYVGYGTHLGRLDGTAITSIGGGFTNNSIWEFARQGDFLFGCNNVDAPRKWNEDTDTLSTITTPPATWGIGAYPTACVTWAGRIFAWKGDTLYYSKLYDCDVWTAGITAVDGGAATIGDDGSDIKACIPFSDGLIIIKGHKGGLWFFTGNGTFNNSTKTTEFDQTTFDWNIVAPSVDCVGQRAWVVVENSLFIWGRDQVFQVKDSAITTRNRLDVINISRNFAHSVKNVSNNLNLVCAVHYKERNQIRFGVPKDSASSTIDTEYTYDYVNTNAKGIGGWGVRTGYSHKCRAEVFDASGVAQIYSGGYSGNSRIYKQNDGVNYDGAAMECAFYTYWIPLGIGASGKSTQAIIGLGSQTTQPISFSYAYDYQVNAYDSDTITPDTPTSSWNTGSGSTWGTGGGTTGTWVSGQPTLTKVPIYGKGGYIQLRFYQNIIDADFDILNITLPVTTMGCRS